MSQLTAISREQFADKTWRRYTSYAFAATSNLLPVTVVELTRLVPAMPLGLVQTENTFQLMAITSLQPGANLFVAPNGSWIGAYIPAVVRAYPFQLAKPQDRKESVLCFNSSSGLLGETGEGEAFFDADGPSPAIKEIMNFLSETETSRALTQRLVDALQAAGLIQPWPLNLQQGEQTVPVQGLFRIDEEALNALPDDELLDLRKTGALPLAYGQLFSMNQLMILQQAAVAQAKIQEQLQAQAMKQTPSAADIGFRFPEGESLKFS